MCLDVGEVRALHDAHQALAVGPQMSRRHNAFGPQLVQCSGLLVLLSRALADREIADAVLEQGIQNALALLDALGAR